MFFRRLFILLFITEQCVSQTGQNYWKRLAKEELKRVTSVKLNTNVAKNVILFVGDGMGVNTVTATRIYKGGESHQLAFEKFPHVGLLKTYSANKMVPDSACSATALFCGIKANQETVGVDATVRKGDCSASLQEHARLDSLAAQALKEGKRVGLVTTTRVTHATPSALYAHSAYRKWECEANMPPDAAQCKDIARQLVEDWPGRDFHVILGGGRQVMESNSTGTPEDPLDTWSCIRKDGKNLTEEYIRDKTKRNFKYSYVTNSKQLNEVKHDRIDYLLGIFANGHMRYEDERNKSPEGMPSITEMVAAAIRVLSRGPKGYFLMVEGGNIDMAHHRGWAKRAINEAAAMDDAVAGAYTMINQHDTLLVVTSDHGHTLSINGYPLRGSNIFGIAQKSPHDGTNYTTLSYSTGGADSFQYEIEVDGNSSKIVRQEPTLDDTDSFKYKQIAAIVLDENSHGGGDVAIYATGPRSFLFSGVHEQHYVFHAICCAAGLNHNVEGCDISSTNRTSEFQTAHVALFIVLLISSFILNRMYV